MNLLLNKKALITGGSSGIGKSIVKAFLEAGASVAFFSTNEQKARDAISEFEKLSLSQSQKISFKVVDVSETKPVEIAVEEVIKEFDGLDILVNNAGIVKDGFLIKMTEAEWDRVIDVNLKSVYNTCKVIARHMMKAKRGKIINISSVVGLIGNIGQTNYSASKAGMIGFTKSLAKELASRGICVNSIAPGFIQTNMTENLSDQIKENLLNSIPMNRFGSADEVAMAALFLASKMSDYITGQVLTVDGGMVM